MKEELKKVKKIVVHPGLAHLDDIMACAVAYACGVRHDAEIERRRPTAEELESAETLVLDVGGRHEPEKMNFDHHQRGRDEEPKCTFKLLSEWAGIDGEMAELFPWYKTWNLIDTCGPTETARMLGMPAGAIDGFMGNPLGDWVIRRFADDPALRHKMALSLGKGIEKTREYWKTLGAKTVETEVDGVRVTDLRGCQTEEISRCSEAWFRKAGTACAVMRDSRGDGLTFLRCGDDPRLDFARCAGKGYCLFAHPGGFILKTRDKGADVAAVIRDATVGGN